MLQLPAHTHVKGPFSACLRQTRRSRPDRRPSFIDCGAADFKTCVAFNPPKRACAIANRWGGWDGGRVRGPSLARSLSDFTNGAVRSIEASLMVCAVYVCVGRFSAVFQQAYKKTGKILMQLIICDLYWRSNLFRRTIINQYSGSGGRR